MAVENGLRAVQVNLGRRSYPIWIGPGACRALNVLIERLDDVSQVVIIADQTVADLHLHHLVADLRGPHTLMTVPPGEETKSLTVAQDLYGRLAAARADRQTLIVAFGGGVTGDLAGFVAATWLRGVRFVQVPTTLLAAVDASIGGKTGVNLAAGKNLVGAFHQPQSVIFEPDFLQTLSERDFIAGLAEVVKHAAIADAPYLAWLENHVKAILARETEALTHLVTESCAIKAEVVEHDERETGRRAILNYGHTIGHAIEHVLNYELRHGECVALGMVAENEIAYNRRWLHPADLDRIKSLLTEFRLPTRLPRPIPAAAICDACRVDKKVRDQAVTMVLLKELGKPRRGVKVTDEQITAGLAAIAPA